MQEEEEEEEEEGCHGRLKEHALFTQLSRGGVRESVFGEGRGEEERG